MRQQQRQPAGFTLLDVVVSVGIFAIVALSATAIFQQVIRGQRIAIATQNTQESLRFTFEAISKELRTARLNGGGNPPVTCGGFPAGRVYYVDANQVLYFKNQYGECVTYEEDSGGFFITRNSNSGYITPDEVVVSNLRFDVVPISASQQPQVTISMTLYNKTFGSNNLYKSQMEVQTTISSRSYEQQP